MLERREVMCPDYGDGKVSAANRIRSVARWACLVFICMWGFFGLAFWIAFAMGHWVPWWYGYVA